ncbi:MAG: SurA N-terminal domain-containing protein [Bacteroidetes bacterium]|nr:SurA N-terminal domain-containing protein [Bacteroidota bacterium]
MALIGTLREKMTKWVVGFVAIAILSFILNDLFGSGPRSIMGGSDDEVGEIAGKSISRDQYQAFVQERENNYIMSFGRKPGEREKPTLEQQAWELLIVEHAIKPQFEKTGIKVTADEVWDMVQGKNVDENVKQSFTDSAGNFDRKRVIEYINNFNVPPPIGNEQMLAQYNEGKYRWTLFQKELGLGRERVKYENLLIKSNYVTEAESERDYHAQNDVAEVKYLYVPFYAISDSAVTPTDSQLRDYFNKNKEKYKTKQTRSLSYVEFPVVASASDSAKLREEAAKIAAEFKTAAEDSSYAVAQSQGSNAYAKYTVATLPASISNDKANLQVGSVNGPFLDGGNYKIVKVVKIGTDTIYAAKASHILIKWENETPEAKKVAKEKARKILSEIKGGARFADKALEHGTDGTRTKGGDLGWFTTGQMVKPFQNAVFDAKKTGLLSDVVETDFGYHIIDVTNIKDNTTYTVATIELAITPSDETQNAAFLKAQNFVAAASDEKEFRAQAQKEVLNVFDAKDLSTAERRVGTLGEARQMVTWLYREGKVGKVSDVFDLDNSYVVAVMTGETEEGFKNFDQVKEQITPLVKNQLKGEKIIEKLAAQKGTLEEVATAFGRDATVNSSSDLKLNSSTLPSVGVDAKAIGVAFSLENGKRSKPFAGENGVLLIETINKTSAPAIGDYTMFKNQLLQGLNGKSSFGISQAIKEVSKIEDTRYKFF